MQIGFLTEWQLYAQKLEGDAWRDERLDGAKIDKMSGELASCSPDGMKKRKSCVLSRCV